MDSIGPVMLDLAGLELSTNEREILKHPQTGGIILFSRNYQDIQQLTELIGDIRRNSHTRLLIAVDHEGGRVQRFKNGFTALPAFGAIGQIYSNNPVQACHYAEQAGWLMAVELLSLGIDFSFTPVLDLDKNISTVIGNRSFNADPLIVIKLAEHYIQGMHRAGMATVGKHFPGHGSVAADSHHEIPIDNRCAQAIFEEDILPFAELIKINALNAIMPAHVIYSQCDHLPAGFSRYWLQTVLREQLKFKGAILSDDLSMAGAANMGSPIERAEKAIEAGCDMVLTCNDPKAAYNVVTGLVHRSGVNHSLSTQRLLKLSSACVYNHSELQKTDEWQQAVKLLAAIN